MNKYIKLKKHIVFVMNRECCNNLGMDETDFILHMQNTHDKLIDEIWDCFNKNNHGFTIPMIEKFTGLLNREYEKMLLIYRGEYNI